MTADSSLSIVDSTQEGRRSLEWILDESFEGWYLRHARRTLQEIQTVRVSVVDSSPVGLAMLKRLDARTGYVFYIAVAKAQRKRGVAGALLDDALARFQEDGVTDVYASVEEENEPSLALFKSRGFTKTGFAELSKQRGALGALIMYREMLAVLGEIVLHRVINQESTPGAQPNLINGAE